MSVLDLARPEHARHTPYVPGQWEPGLLRLNANESPWRAPGDTTERGLNRLPAAAAGDTDREARGASTASTRGRSS